MQNHHAGGSSTMIFKTPPRPTQRKVGGTPGSCVEGSPPSSSSKSHDDLNNLIADKLRESGVMTSDQLFEVARPYYKQTDCKSELSQWARARIANLRKKRKVWPTAHMVFGTIKMQGRKRDASVGEVGMWEFEGLRKSIRPEKFYEAPRTVYWSWEHGLAKHALSAAYAGDEHTPGTASLVSSSDAVDSNGDKSGTSDTSSPQGQSAQQSQQTAVVHDGAKQLTISSSAGGLNFTEELISPTFEIRNHLTGTHLNGSTVPSPLTVASQASVPAYAANTSASAASGPSSKPQAHPAATGSAYTSHGGALKRAGDPSTADPQSVAFHEAIESIRANMTPSTTTRDGRHRSASESSPRSGQDATVTARQAEDAALLLASAAEISRRESSSSPPHSDPLSQSNPEGGNRLLLLAQIAQSEISKQDGDTKSHVGLGSGTEQHMKRAGLSPKKQRTVVQEGHAAAHPSHLSQSPVLTAASKAGRPPPPRKGGPHRGAKYRCGRCGYYPKSVPHDCMTGQAFPRSPSTHSTGKHAAAPSVVVAAPAVQASGASVVGASDATASTPSTPPESPRYQSRPKHYACGKCGFFPKSAPHDCRTGKATTANAKLAAQSPKRKHLRREPNPSSPNGGEGGGRPRQYRCGKCGFFPKADKHDCETGLACPPTRPVSTLGTAMHAPGDAASGAQQQQQQPRGHSGTGGGGFAGDTVISSGVKGVAGVHRHDSDGSGSNSGSPTRVSGTGGTPIGSPSNGAAGQRPTQTGRRRQYKCGKCNFFPKTTPHDCALYQGNTSGTIHTSTSPPQQSQQQSTFPVRPVNVRTVYPATTTQDSQHWSKHTNTSAEHVAASALLYSANRGMNRA
eukprot:m.757789 g.757789  ORF g.757789 m.757789 type:complete len:851 (+) comp23190_c1_seq2:240-2792(+)